MRTYPRDNVPLNYHGIVLRQEAHYEQALEEAREELRLAPHNGWTYGDMAIAYLALDRPEEAKAVLDQAFAQKVEQAELHGLRYTIGFVQGDADAMRREVDWFKGRPDESFVRQAQAQVAAFGGRRGQARELYAQAVDLARRGGFEEAAAHTLLDEATTEAVFGNARRAREQAAQGLALSRASYIPLEAARAFALSSAADQAQPLLDEIARRFPSSTLLQEVDLPTLRAVLELQRGGAAKALELLKPTTPYELGDYAPYAALYVRGLAHLRLGSGTDAAAQFQKILDHRGIGPLSPLYPLAKLSLARAAALSGDAAKARRAYQDFLALWKDADGDVPVLQEAKKEYASLKLDGR